MKYFRYVITGLIVVAAGIFIGGKYDPFGVHHLKGPQVQFQGGGLIGQAYVPCSAPTGNYATAGPSASPKLTTASWSADGKIFNIVGCDGNPVGPYHYQGLVQTQAQQSTSAGACLASGTCQINAEVATGSAANPAPTCPISQQCLAFNGTMTDVTDGGNIAVSGLIVVSTSSIPQLTGVGAGNYVRGSAATAWQHPFSVCKLGSGRCQMDLFFATVPAPGTVTTSTVPGCSTNAQECLAFNGSSMASVNDSQTVGAAITIDMPSQ